MKNLSKILGLAAVVAATSLGGSQALAQDQQRPPGGAGGGAGGVGGGGGRGNFDPAQMRQRMMERMREQLEVKDDAEWKVIETRIEKVTEARRDTGGFGGMGMMRGGGPGGPGGQGGGGRGRGGFGGAQLPEAEDLQKAIDSKASADEIKGKMAKLREARKSKEAELEKAQDDLRKLLSVRQEAIAVVNGLLK